jgi:hypothetical protein
LDVTVLHEVVNTFGHFQHYISGKAFANHDICFV